MGLKRGLLQHHIKGRDCIEKNSSLDFNCSSTCDGLYADVQWVDEETEDVPEEDMVEMTFKGMPGDDLQRFMLSRIVEIERKMESMKRGSGEKGEKLDREKYRMMVMEYREFKRKNMRHFMFNSGANSSSFGKISSG